MHHKRLVERGRWPLQAVVLHERRYFGAMSPERTVGRGRRHLQAAALRKRRFILARCLTSAQSSTSVSVYRPPSFTSAVISA